MSGPSTPTYLEWDREVLEQCYPYVDGLSLHRYLGNTPDDTGGDSSKYLALNLTMDRQIEETMAVCGIWCKDDIVRGSGCGFPLTSGMCGTGQGPERERRGISPGFASAGGSLQPGRRVACRWLDEFAAPPCGPGENRLPGAIGQRDCSIVTNKDGLYLQTIYYPYSWGLEYARGTVLNILTGSPTYEVAGMGQVPYLDVVGTSADDGKVSLFILNRDLAKAQSVEVNWQNNAPKEVSASLTLTGSDLKAANSFEAPRKVVPQGFLKPATSAGRTKFEVPPQSYTVVQWRT